MNWAVWIIGKISKSSKFGVFSGGFRFVTNSPWIALCTKISWAWANMREDSAANVSGLRSGVGSCCSAAITFPLRWLNIPADCWNKETHKWQATSCRRLNNSVLLSFFRSYLLNWWNFDKIFHPLYHRDYSSTILFTGFY